jgi:hypothetical protein
VAIQKSHIEEEKYVNACFQLFSSMGYTAAKKSPQLEGIFSSLPFQAVGVWQK